jgi:hypothetical protein
MKKREEEEKEEVSLQYTEQEYRDSTFTSRSHFTIHKMKEAGMDVLMGEKYIWFNGENGWEDPRDITILIGYREIKDDA